MKRSMSVIGLVGVLGACAVSPNVEYDPWELNGVIVSQYWQPFGEGWNGVKLMMLDEGTYRSEMKLPSPDHMELHFRAANFTPERKCYRWAVATTNARRDDRNVIDSGWQELPPTRPGESRVSDKYWNTLEWGYWRLERDPIVRSFLALNVPPQGTCQSYRDAIFLDAKTGEWSFDWGRLLAIAGTDEFGRSRIQQLFGEIKSVRGGGGEPVPVEFAAGLRQRDNATPGAKDAARKAMDGSAVESLAMADTSTSTASANRGLPANYLALSQYERLTIAAGAGIVNEVRLLLDAGTSVNARDASGMTALMRAAEGGHRQVVEALLAYGADPKLATVDGRNAASMATAAGHNDIARLLGNRPSATRP